uniref:Uncharacterized protein n=1 Tax=Aegilops tauschii subsp. strangulata TaxID=200361 RepID=A0A453DZS5_AEGTS
RRNTQPVTCGSFSFVTNRVACVRPYPLTSIAFLSTHPSAPLPYPFFSHPVACVLNPHSNSSPAYSLSHGLPPNKQLAGRGIGAWRAGDHGGAHTKMQRCASYDDQRAEVQCSSSCMPELDVRPLHGHRNQGSLVAWPSCNWPRGQRICAGTRSTPRRRKLHLVARRVAANAVRTPEVATVYAGATTGDWGSCKRDFFRYDARRQ